MALELAKSYIYTVVKLVYSPPLNRTCKSFKSLLTCEDLLGTKNWLAAIFRSRAFDLLMQIHFRFDS